ncbi:hypothetical protein PR048_008449 [Dryococelus australis]|uniref:Uncharacterized protein n=1 Tax=Dryococelus australis TaxID=614101 RepID=A0ABQ9HY21_9NEOP|nr:hypothetical protein PR048_008449 [Dryococelus australis]
MLGFLLSVIFTDGATFTRGSIVNIHNTYLWATQNPRGLGTANYQHRFSFNVSAGIIGDRLVGPVLLPQRLTGEACLHFPRLTLPPLLEEVPLVVRRVVWLLQDGAPAQFRITVRRYLYVFPGRWIGRGGLVAWPSRSADLNPLDFYLWRHLKYVLCPEHIPDVQTLGQPPSRFL